ncbi:MAG: malto-oligosyltrehalose trehalohydrolase, partial [Longimicrobiales bacterium]
TWAAPSPAERERPSLLSPPLGATAHAHGCRFHLWAAAADRVDLVLQGPPSRTIALDAVGEGCFTADVDEVRPGALYSYRVDGGPERPDPASRGQPRGVHGPSRVVAAPPGWRALIGDGAGAATWTTPAFADYVIYELHVGTFSRAGTFAGVIPHLAQLRDAGITAIELMPIAQFPGQRNWGYDGVFPFAAHDSYGGLEALLRLVDAAHALELAVVLDVVYNHLGPEGNYLRDYGPYFTPRHRTPWGEALNFDDAGSDGVRRYFIENALWWTLGCGIDALRLDAVHAIADMSPYPFLEELVDTVHEKGRAVGRRVYLVAESDTNDPRVIRGHDRGGLGMDAQWADDLHHALHGLLTGERSGYYADFGAVDQLGRALTGGHAYRGEYSTYRRRRHGRSADDLPAERFVVCSQNHDQVGNRMLGERLSGLVDFESLKLAAATVLLSPFVPLLFMGEEHGDPAPFPYFISHGDPELVQAVRAGRAEEFAGFRWAGEPPDPQAEATFASARIRHELKDEGRHRVLFAYYRELLGLRRGLYDRAWPVASLLEAQVVEEAQLLVGSGRAGPCFRALDGAAAGRLVALLLHFGDAERTIEFVLPAGSWQPLLQSADTQWDGPGATLPTALSSTGSVQVVLPARSAALLVSI